MFYTLDLLSGYGKIKVTEDYKEKAIFGLPMGKFQFEVMPFGLMNYPSNFQSMKDKIFSDLAFVTIYLDDVVIFYLNINERVDHRSQIFELIVARNLIVKI